MSVSVAEQVRSFPPVVYLPCERPPSGDELTVDLRPTRDGQMALLVYSALNRLVRCCGERQPWVVLPTAKLEMVDQYAHFDTILLDVEVPFDQWRRAEEAR